METVGFGVKRPEFKISSSLSSHMTFDCRANLNLPKYEMGLMRVLTSLATEEPRALPPVSSQSVSRKGSTLLL